MRHMAATTWPFSRMRTTTATDATRTVTTVGIRLISRGAAEVARVMITSIGLLGGNRKRFFAGVVTWMAELGPVVALGALGCVLSAVGLGPWAMGIFAGGQSEHTARGILVTLAIGCLATLASMQDFTKLRVWNEAHAFAVAIDRALANAAKGRADLTNQLRRSADSIAANIAEGAGQVTDPQFARFLVVALGSTTESTNHLMLARDTHVIATSTAADLLAQAGRIRGMLINLLKRLNT